MIPATLLFFSLAACGTDSAPTEAATTPPAAAPAPPPAAATSAPPEGAAPPPPPAATGAASAAGPADATHGKAVYDQYCVACHQADGTGMGGALGANFRDDAERMAKPDEALLHSIREGVTGKVGTMPPWGATLSAQDQVDVLAYIRSFHK